MKHILLFVCLSIFTQNLKSQIDPTLATQLQNILNSKVPSNHGVSAHLILPTGETWSGTAGVGPSNVPITPTTVFHGASTTKLNIAILMMMLAEQNLINLDASWSSYISLNVAFNPTITIRQLLNHTSGIADYLETAATLTNVTSNYNYSYTPTYILENIVSGTPLFPAGTNFAYSTSNYVLAALIAQTVTGQPVETQLRTRIWNPLGMKHTYFGASETFTESTAGVWWDFGGGFTDYSAMPTTSMLSYGYGGANIVTCPTDLALLIHALNTTQLISAQSLSEMMTFVPNSNSFWAGYGLGIHHASVNNMLVGHDGYYTNLTDMFYSKKSGFSLVTMSNTGTSAFGIFNPMYTAIANYYKTVGLAETETALDWSIYPNPAKGQFNIRGSQSIDQISIKDILGREILSTQPNTKTANINLEHEGVYFVTLLSRGQSLTKKLVVQN